MEKFIDENILENPEKSSFWDFKSKYEFVDDWFLMSSPYPIAVLTVGYLLFVLKLGPDYMKNRKPFQLKNTLLAYNMFQVAISMAMVKLCVEKLAEIGVIQRTCMTDTFEEKYSLATLNYYYLACKITELADTVIFVLRKKQNQVTFLHVYHHFIMVWNSWAFLKYEPGYWMVFMGGLNSFVHTVMYSYYGLSAYPSLHKYLWWKKYITSLQLLQFGLLVIHMTINNFVNECIISKWTVVYYYLHAILFIYLFSRFYRKSYSNSDKKVENGFRNNNRKVKLNDDFSQRPKHRNANTMK